PYNWNSNAQEHEHYAERQLSQPSWPRVVKLVADAAASLGEQAAFRAGLIAGDAAQVVAAAVAFVDCLGSLLQGHNRLFGYMQEQRGEQKDGPGCVLHRIRWDRCRCNHACRRFAGNANARAE